MEKRIEIQRVDGTVIIAEQTGPQTFRLTMGNKPYNMTDSLQRQYDERYENERD